MATKTEIVNDMKRFAGASFITRKQLADYMGFKDPHSVDVFLAPLQQTKHRYFIPEVVERIIEQ